MQSFPVTTTKWPTWETVTYWPRTRRSKHAISMHATARQVLEARRNYQIGLSEGKRCRFFASMSDFIHHRKSTIRALMSTPEKIYSFSLRHELFNLLTLTALKYFCINHGDQRVFKFEIISNVLVSFFWGGGGGVFIRQNLTPTDVRF